MFDDIRPYYDSEIPSAMRRITQSEDFPLIASYIYPMETVEAVRQRVLACRTIAEFQRGIMHAVNDRIIFNSISEFSCNGLERLDKSRSYLYISNHRDIMLDASLLQNCLVDNGFDTSEITFGANLMMSPTIIDIGKSNKMFRVERPGGSARDFYKKSRHLSCYIRHTITEKRQSVWIAQRNGRTKDGNDTTDQGLIKMLRMSRPEGNTGGLGQLNIVPVAISYEWETCDVLKTVELYESRSTSYVKKPGEDLNSILKGITQHKGRVHIEVCEPIRYEELAANRSKQTSSFNQAVASLIDSRIIAAYRLYPNNYIAYDIKYGSPKYTDYYTEEQQEAFTERMDSLGAYADACDVDVLRDIFVGIYANPVKAKETL